MYHGMARCATAVTLICLVNRQQCKPASSAQESPRPLVSFGGSAIAIHSLPSAGRCNFEVVTIEEMLVVKLVHNLQSNCVCAITIDVIEAPIQTVV